MEEWTNNTFTKEGGPHALHELEGHISALHTGKGDGYGSTKQNENSYRRDTTS